MKLLGDVSNNTVASELQRIYKRSCFNQFNLLEELRLLLGVSDELAAVKGLSPHDLINLGGRGVRSIDDLADLCSDELIEIVGADVLPRHMADNIIMTARKRWFEGDAHCE
jgi:N utilization substance protein A